MSRADEPVVLTRGDLTVLKDIISNLLENRYGEENTAWENLRRRSPDLPELSPYSHWLDDAIARVAALGGTDLHQEAPATT